MFISTLESILDNLYLICNLTLKDLLWVLFPNVFGNDYISYRVVSGYLIWKEMHVS